MDKLDHLDKSSQPLEQRRQITIDIRVPCDSGGSTMLKFGHLARIWAKFFLTPSTSSKDIEVRDVRM